MLNNIPKTIGVYCFWNKPIGLVYVGSTKNLNARIKQHINKSSNKPLRDSLERWGVENFNITYWVLETKDEALKLEQEFLNFVFYNYSYCYNLAQISIKKIFHLRLEDPEDIKIFDNAEQASGRIFMEVNKIKKGCARQTPVLDYFEDKCLLSSISQEDLKNKLTRWLDR